VPSNPSDNLTAAQSAPSAAAAATETSWLDLAAFDNSDYDPGRGVFIRTVWYFCSLLFFESGWLPVSRVKVWLLRQFGARMGRGVVIKPHVRIKYPWRVAVGDHCWIGQGVWIDNLADVHVGNHVCISQLAYLCTGSHDHRTRGFDLITKPIDVRDGAWLGARCTILPGVTVGANALVAGGSVAAKDVEPASIVAGVPAKTVGARTKPST
jgi:putative colanic acid biosynthesis acetyltransferase WcaF